MKNKLIGLSLATLTWFMGFAQAGEVVVIGHPGVPKMDVQTIQKIYTGKIVNVSGVNIVAVSQKSGSAARNKFLQNYLNQDDEKYIAYWTVRRYVGKGFPPQEMPSLNELIQFVLSTPGAVAYIDEADLRSGMNVIAKH
jgi:ABC-type phosphate transport system substrate-binding protein